MASVHLFLRPDMSCGIKKLIEGGGGGKGRCCDWPNSYKENEDTRNIGIYIKNKKYIYIYIIYIYI